MFWREHGFEALFLGTFSDNGFPGGHCSLFINILFLYVIH